MKTGLSTYSSQLRRLFGACGTVTILVVSTSFLTATLLMAQDQARIQKLADEANRLVKEMENCGSDMACINRTTEAIQELSKRIK